MRTKRIISYLSIFIGHLLIKLSINPVSNLLAFTRQHALLFIHQRAMLSVGLCECGINKLLFCNVSLRLTSDTLSHVNNKSDDLHVQGIEETC